MSKNNPTKYYTSTDRRFLLSLAGYTILAASEIIPTRVFATMSDIKPIDQPLDVSEKAFIDQAFEMRRQAIENGDQAYGAIIVCGGIIVGQSPSLVVVNSDPTAHAEMQAIRDASMRLSSRDLSNCILYSSSRACPMCEAAAYWAGIDRMIYGEAITDAGRPSLCR